MNLSKTIMLILFYFVMMSSFATNSDHFEKLKANLTSKNPNQLQSDIELRKVVSSLEKKFNQKDLEVALGFYHYIFKMDSNYYVTEMFIELYKKNKKKFVKALSKSLNDKDRKTFLNGIKMAMDEIREGNG